MIVIDLLVLILFIALYSKIRIAIAIIKAASSSLIHIPSAILYIYKY